MECKVGDVIDRLFEVKDIKGGPGKSGFGIVYISYCQAWKQMVAVKGLQEKYLYRGDTHADKVVEDFYREAETWVKLERYPNIVEAITVGKVGWGEPYIVLEYVGGGSLRDQLVSGRLSIHEALKFGIQFCHGMIYANSKDLGEGKRGIVHRDVKPANIMLTKDGVLKITDFGLVKALGAPTVETPAGTPEYMSPEQFWTMDVDTRSDIYSFGVVLYEMLTGRPPFYIGIKEERWNYCKRQHHEVLPKPPSQIDSSTPPALERAVLKCLEKRTKDRYQSFEALREDLMEIYQDLYGGRPEMKEEVKAVTAEAWFNRGNALSNLGKHDDAIDYFHKALRINPEYEGAWLCLGVAYYGLGNKEESMRCHDKVLEINPKNTDAWANKGVVLKDLGQFGEAINCLNTALEINPRRTHAWNMMGMTLYDSTANMRGALAVEYLKEAVRCFDKALEINPRNPTAWNNKGVALNRLGLKTFDDERFYEAIRCFDKAIEISPRYSDAWVSKAAAVSNLGKPEDALRCYDRAIKIEPGHVKAWNSKALILDELDRREEARRCLAEAYFHNGLRWARTGRFRKAVECYDRALKWNPRHAKAWNNKGISLFFLGTKREAIECYDRALDIDPTDTSVWRNKAKALEDLGLGEEADRCLNIIIELEKRAKPRPSRLGER